MADPVVVRKHYVIDCIAVNQTEDNAADRILAREEAAAKECKSVFTTGSQLQFSLEASRDRKVQGNLPNVLIQSETRDELSNRFKFQICR